jgi:phage gp29-like protein
MPDPKALPMSTTPDTRLVDQWGNYIESRVPTDRRSKPLRRFSPTYIDASVLDVDIVHALLTNSDVGDARQVLALYDQILFSDSHIQTELAKRKLAVLGDPWAVVPADKKNPDDVKAAAMAQAQLEAMDMFFDARSHLLDSSLWPVTLVEKTYKFSSTPGLKFDMNQLIPVEYFMLYLDPTGPLRIFDVSEDGTVMGTHKMADPMRYVVHRGHLLGTRDHRGGPMRSLVFWWLFSVFDRDWWVRFLDRFGTPFPVGKYDQSDDEARAILMSAFSLATRLGGLVISNETEVELKEVNTQAAGEAFELFHDICQKEKSKLIIGQTSSSNASHGSGGGLGAGVANVQGEVRDDIRRFDQIRLGDTILNQIVNPWKEINRLPGKVKVTIGAEATEDTAKTSQSLAELKNAGLEVGDEGLPILSERFGFPLRRLQIATPPPDSGADRPSNGRSLATLAAAIANNPALLAADHANARVARTGSAELAQAFREDLAPLQELIALSTSPADFERRLRDTFPHLPPGKAIRTLEACLTAYALNALPG